MAALAQPAAAASKGKVVVFGGAGWVGAHVVKLLQAEGAEVVSVSRASPNEQAAKAASIMGSATDGVKYMSLDASNADLSAVLAGASAVVSCVGALPGSSNQRAGNVHTFWYMSFFGPKNTCPALKLIRTQNSHHDSFAEIRSDS